MKDHHKKKFFVFLIISVIVTSLIVIGCNGEEEPGPSEDGMPDEEIMPGEEGTPYEEVVATVNGEEITSEEFVEALEQEKMQYEMQGMDLDSPEMEEELHEIEQQVLNNYFIYPLLLEQKAEEEGITVSDEEIEETYQEYVMYFGGEEELEEQMEAANISRGELNEEIVRGISLQKYQTQYVGKYLEGHPDEVIREEELELSTEEVEKSYLGIRSQYDQLKAELEAGEPKTSAEQVKMTLEQMEEQYGEILEADDFEEVRTQLEEMMRTEKASQMKQEQEQSIIMAHIEELEEKSDIEINI
ncbi:MAG: SurA N-terminal domain-containing protein [Dehalococcoidia bacterium]